MLSDAKSGQARILQDINMPHVNGHQVMAGLKALNDSLLRPIVILTAQHNWDDWSHASPMHDIGKTGVPDSILLKLAHTITLTHHEKWDGSGYPERSGWRVSRAPVPAYKPASRLSVPMAMTTACDAFM